MENFTINGKQIELNLDALREVEVYFFDENSQSNKVVTMEEITIKPRPGLIKVIWASWDILPGGQRVNKKELPRVISNPEDYEFFVSVFGGPIKKFSMNGLFRNSMQRFGISSFALFDQAGEKITDQPVPFPEPEIDEINLGDLGLNE